MLMTVLESLRASGVAVEQLEVATPELSDQPDAVIRILTEGAEKRFAVEEKQRAPYPNELPRLALRREVLESVGSALLVVPFVSETLGVALAESGWSWADDQGNFDLRAPGLLLKQRRIASTPRAERKGLPRGAGSFAIIRALISFGAWEVATPPRGAPRSFPGRVWRTRRIGAPFLQPRLALSSCRSRELTP